MQDEHCFEVPPIGMRGVGQTSAGEGVADQEMAKLVIAPRNRDGEPWKQQESRGERQNGRGSDGQPTAFGEPVEARSEPAEIASNEKRR